MWRWGRFLTVSALLLSAVIPAMAIEGELLPTVIRNLEDQWRETLPGRPARPVVLTEVAPNQPFTLYFVVVKPALNEGRAHVTVDLKLKSPNGQERVLGRNNDITLLNGAVTADQRILSGTVLQMTLPKGQPTGEYELVADFVDHADLGRFAVHAKIRLLEERVDYPPDAGNPAPLLVNYYRNPQPEKAIGLLKGFYGRMGELSAEKDFTPRPFLYGFSLILKDNPQLWPAFAQWTNSLDGELLTNNLLMICQLGDKVVNRFKPNLGIERSMKLESVPRNVFRLDEITQAMQLDLLWMEFAITGKAAPIVRLAGELERLADAFSMTEYQAKKDIRHLTETEKRQLQNYMIGYRAKGILEYALREHPLVRDYLEAAAERNRLPGPRSLTEVKALLAKPGK